MFGRLGEDRFVALHRPLLRSDIEVFANEQVVTDRYCSLGLQGGGGPLLVDTFRLTEDLRESKVTVLLRRSGMIDPLQSRRVSHIFYGRAFLAVNQDMVLHLPTEVVVEVCNISGEVAASYEYLDESRSVKWNLNSGEDDMVIADISLVSDHQNRNISATSWHHLDSEDMLRLVVDEGGIND